MALSLSSPLIRGDLVTVEELLVGHVSFASLDKHLFNKVFPYRLLLPEGDRCTFDATNVESFHKSHLTQ